MPQPATEHASDRYRGIDTWPAGDIFSEIVANQRAAIDAVGAAIPALAAAGEAAAQRLRDGGRLVYAGAGSSGLLALVDALELPGTFGMAPVPVLLAGGAASLREIQGGAEDDAAEAETAVAENDIGRLDVLVALSASGRTPYPLAALRSARRRGALTIGIASNADTPLLTEAHHAILLATPPEVIAGSTRMNAGTAQKCALNMFSTLIGIRLGHGYDGLMVNVRAENTKLRERARGIVARAAGVDAEHAAEALRLADDETKAAILLCAGAAQASVARGILARCGGDLRAALAAIRESAEPSAVND